ncbi:transketolase [Rhodoblastus acidophilus]|uniref:Transketolase n=1 Tax=Candidatus Rhodoblastus alkanivorans TaxID=2954117 RepID=A0ABS9Z8Z9_9HYPH|nr:transketolase [Candidatus Rhodoblastus alkanivorans]MCI4679636.1 transketolase [Candidatus Rhodoblastus alkanivorans]MCI4683672.1 transketolase [Candidatus Rhodoblastus alkanivorans]MDI4640989.1 transketolase [Rhodoblastus acidophilus]
MNETMLAERASAAGPSFGDMANAIRALAMDAVEKAKSGHPGMPMGMADVATVLFTRFMKLNPADPAWPDRDRFVLSAGHGSMLQYALHYLVGYADMPIEQLQKFRQLGSHTAGHPEYGHALGIETTTGPLGQGIATAVGMALAERMMNARYGDDLVDHYTYAIAGDGCLMEGLSHEAIDLAGHLKLGKLIVLWDDNHISIDGSTDLSTSTDQVARFAACGWNTIRVNGHDEKEIEAAISKARAQGDKPWLIACNTIIGYGAPTRAGTSKAHGEALGAEEIAGAREKLDWPHTAFVVPEPVLIEWRKVAARGAAAEAQWKARLAATPKAAAFNAQVSGEVPAAVDAALKELIAKHVAERPKIATRKSSEIALAAINGATDITIGGSADLTHSNLTITKGMESVKTGAFGGRYIHYGVREHGMAAAMNGIALHGGFIPYGGTFLVFSDYARGAIRLSALMGVRVVYVLTHDSIGLGEDGPTHQPVETVAALRAMPNLLVFRPCDAVETAEAWAVALAEKRTPSALALSRQGLTALRTEDTGENLTAKGAYVLRETEGPRDVTILATGSEVEVAVAAAHELGMVGVKAAVVSMPCWELFERQSDAYQREVLGTAPRVGVEAALRFGWDRWLGERSAFIGMTGFGASAPAPELYKHFGITAEAVAAAAQSLISKE